MENKQIALWKMNNKGSLESVLSFIIVGIFAFLIIGGMIFFQQANGSNQLANSPELNSTYSNLQNQYTIFGNQANSSYSNFSTDPGVQSTSILGGTTLTFATIPQFFKFVTSGIVGIYQATLGLVYNELKIPVPFQYMITIFIFAGVIFGIWKALRIGLPD